MRYHQTLTDKIGISLKDKQVLLLKIILLLRVVFIFWRMSSDYPNYKYLYLFLKKSEEITLSYRILNIYKLIHLFRKNEIIQLLFFFSDL